MGEAKRRRAVVAAAGAGNDGGILPPGMVHMKPELRKFITGLTAGIECEARQNAALRSELAAAQMAWLEKRLERLKAKTSAKKKKRKLATPPTPHPILEEDIRALQEAIRRAGNMTGRPNLEDRTCPTRSSD